MPATEVIQVDLVGPGTERHPIPERPGRQAVAVRVGKDVRRRLCPTAVWPHHGHVGLRDFVRHELDRGRERDVAAHMVVMAMRVDECRDRVARQRLDLLQDRLSPARVLRVDDDDSGCRDEDRRVPATPRSPQHEQIVFQLLDLDDLGRLLSRHDGKRERGDADQQYQNASAFHHVPPILLGRMRPVSSLVRLPNRRRCCSFRASTLLSYSQHARASADTARAV